MSKSTKKVTMSQDNTNSTKVAELTSSLKAAQDQAQAWQIVASEAAQNLFTIESKFAPILSRKFNFFTALMHLQMYIQLIREVIELIANFKSKYAQKPQNDTPAN